MRYWNQDLDALEAPELVAASAQAYGAWSRICAYCVRLENAGILRGAAHWQLRQWIATCRIELADLYAALEAGLVTTQGEDIRVAFYPHQRQHAEQARRFEGAVAGAISTPAKAEAARSNGRLGGRPRTRQMETHKTHENPRQNPRETQEKPTAKPTGFASTSENGPETQGKVREEKVSSGGFVARAAFQPPTYRPNFDLAHATASPRTEADAEKDEDWLSRLTREWPRLDIVSEIEAARRKHPTGFDRPWFEKRWLPHAKPRIASAPRVAGACSVKLSALPEPEGWQAELADSKYGPGGSFEARTWAELPADVQKLTTDRLRARHPAHV